MERVEEYVNKKFRHAGNSKEALSQKEELIAGLHDKMMDAMSLGKSEDEAFADAIASLDGMEELTKALNAKCRAVYVNRLNFHHSLITFGLIALELLACGAFYLAGELTRPSGQQSYMDMPYFDTHTVSLVLIGLMIALLVAAVYPLVRGITYRTNSGMVRQVDFDLRKRVVIPALGWLAVLFALTIINMAPIPKAAGPVIWFIWPVIGVTNWPLAVLTYNKLFRNRRYLA